VRESSRCGFEAGSEAQRNDRGSNPPPAISDATNDEERRDESRERRNRTGFEIDDERPAGAKSAWFKSTSRYLLRLAVIAALSLGELDAGDLEPCAAVSPVDHADLPSVRFGDLIDDTQSEAGAVG